MNVDCYYINECASSKDKSRCKICGNNKLRNYIEDHFYKAKDNPIPKECPKLTYKGPAEQTAGYECPVCGGHTNPYQIDSKSLCKWCGYKLNT